jgi:hypothetical protein
MDRLPGRGVKSMTCYQVTSLAWVWSPYNEENEISWIKIKGFEQFNKAFKWSSKLNNELSKRKKKQTTNP